MMYPDNLRYTDEHEWIQNEDGIYAVGITAYATEQLGDITYVELPEIGIDVSKGESVASVESVKAASDVYAPVSGHICEVNEELETRPELVNKSTYEDGWLYKLESVNTTEFRSLLDAASYRQFVEEEES